MTNVLLMNRGNRDFFMATNHTRKTRNLLKDFMFRVGTIGLNMDSETLRDEMEKWTDKNWSNVSFKCTFAQYELRETDNGVKYHHFEGAGFILNAPINDPTSVIIEV